MNEKLKFILALIKDDNIALSFQSMNQYREWLIKNVTMVKDAK